MDKKISQKEYLKKYLSSRKDKKKVKKKKPNLGSQTVKIIDDDIDLKNMRAIEDGEIDIYATTEDGPQIAGIVDERGPVDFSDKKRWKIITDDGFGDISVTSVNRNEIVPAESCPNNEIANSKSTKNNSAPQDSDHSPPRRSKKDSDSDEPPRKKFSSKKRVREVSGPVKNCSDSQDSDFSPPRRPRKDSDSDETRKRKSASKKHQRKDSSPVKNRSGSQDSDFSPPRRLRKNSDSDEPRKRKSSSKKRPREVCSPVQKRSGSQGSDFSPHRRPRKDSDSDLSPPRNSKAKKREKEHKSREEYDSNSRKKTESKYNSKQSENSNFTDSRRRNYNERTSRSRYSVSPSGRNVPYKSGKHGNENYSSEHDRKHQRSRQDRRKMDDTSELPRNRRKEEEIKNSTTHSRKGENNSDSDLSPPREPKNKSRNFEPESKIPQKSKNYQQMSAETSGFGQAPILRDRKTGRRRDLAAEAREQVEKDGKRQELEEKYAQWGRGLKQVEDRQEKLDRDLYEMSKPLARYADDADLERELKAQEREGDPMLAYMKRKHVKEGKQEPEKPKYNGPSMPNRFGIRPGYRWDGVDRSNGYEKKWFEAQNARKAVQEEAYKWSTADM